jgi:hypothetical protein
MKTRLIVLLLGIFGLFGSAAVLAHNSGPAGSYGGVPLSGGITIWGDSYGRSGYAGNVSLGFGNGYAVPGYVAVPVYGHVAPYGYYQQGYRHGRGHGHYRNRHHGHHGGKNRDNHRRGHRDYRH